MQSCAKVFPPPPTALYIARNIFSYMSSHDRNTFLYCLQVVLRNISPCFPKDIPKVPLWEFWPFLHWCDPVTLLQYWDAGIWGGWSMTDSVPWWVLFFCRSLENYSSRLHLNTSIFGSKIWRREWWLKNFAQYCKLQELILSSCGMTTDQEVILFHLDLKAGERFSNASPNSLLKSAIIMDGLSSWRK